MKKDDDESICPCVCGGSKTKQHILNVVSDLVSRLFYYDRKEDETLGVGDIEDAIADGVLTIKDITEQFAQLVTKHYYSSL